MQRGMALLLILQIILFTSLYINEIAANKINDCSGYIRKTYPIQNKNQKEFVNCLGSRMDSGKSELVILMDTSGSMLYNRGIIQGKSYDGFEVSKRFVKALLSEVRIAYNATRIAIGTFSSTHQININYINNVEFGNHKCKFVNEFRKIPFEAQMTDIKGPLIDARNIFRDLANAKTQRRSNQVVILITDGYGNVHNGKYYRGVGDARPEAKLLKEGNLITLYTVGVGKPGSVDTKLLKDIASHPTSYLDSPNFTNLANLASNIRGGKK